MRELVSVWMALNTVVGAGTSYLAPTGTDLYCSTPARPYTYDPEMTWVALPASEFGMRWQREDLIYVRPLGGISFMARVLDAGPFGKHCVLQPDGECWPIVVDVPKHVATWPGLSSPVPVEVINFSAIARACYAEGLCD